MQSGSSKEIFKSDGVVQDWHPKEDFNLQRSQRGRKDSLWNVILILPDQRTAEIKMLFFMIPWTWMRLATYELWGRGRMERRKGKNEEVTAAPYCAADRENLGKKLVAYLIKPNCKSENCDQADCEGRTGRGGWEGEERGFMPGWTMDYRAELIVLAVWRSLD